MSEIVTIYNGEIRLGYGPGMKAPISLYVSAELGIAHMTVTQAKILKNILSEIIENAKHERENT